MADRGTKATKRMIEEAADETESDCDELRSDAAEEGKEEKGGKEGLG
jgi:hypothetical protein